MLAIDRDSLDILSDLNNAWAENHSGVPHEELDFSDDTFLFLLHNELIKAPETTVIEIEGDPLIVYEGMIYITPQGRGVLEAKEDAASEAGEIRRHNAKQEKQARFYNQTAVVSVIVSILSFAFGVIVEYRSGIMERIIDLIG